MKILDAEGDDNRFPKNMDPVGRVFMSRLSNLATPITLTSNTAYFVYLGRTTRSITVKFVEFYVSTAGGGTQAAEVGLFRTPGPPNKWSQSLTKLAATGTVDSLTTTGLKRNTTSLDCTVGAAIHLWAGIRTQMSATQPALVGLCMDFSQGLVLVTASAGVLTGAGPWAGVLATLGQYPNSPIAPDLRATLD